MLAEQERAELIAVAQIAASRAYCPYSKFRVGAAVRTGDGKIFFGCNVENASYGLTICAERNAVFQAVARCASPITLRAVVVFTPTQTPTAPCGACRQVLNEFGPDCEVLCVCDGPDQLHFGLGQLLPHSFGPHHLNG
jgi:cytidine deaminase